jgi:hypothetical protein
MPPNIGYAPPRPTTIVPGYWGTGNQLGGFVSGVSDVINSQGNFMIQRAQANLMREQVNQAKLDTRRKTIEEWQYERAVTPSAEDIRLKNQMLLYQRAQNDPPLTEILNGDALNTLLQHVQQAQSSGVRGPTVLLNQEMLKKINVTDGNSNGAIAMLQANGKLRWPLCLRGAAFAEYRQRIDQLVPQLVQQANSGGVDPDTLGQVQQTIESIRKRLKKSLDTLSSSQSMEARGYLNQLAAALQTLQDPSATNYLSGKWSARGATVAELTENMTREGLRFAGHGQADEAAYRALYNALLAYDKGLISLTTARTQ